MARGWTNKSLLSANAGEWSPRLNARVDLDKYGAAAQALRNMIPTPYGPFYRRPGTQFIAATKYHTKPSRLIDFQFSTSTTYILEVGETYMRFYANGGQVVHTLATTAGTWSVDTATITVASPHRLVVGDIITVAGVTSGGPGSFNVANAVVTATPTTTQISYALATDPGTYSGAGTVEMPYDIETPWDDQDVAQLQWTQINDVMYLTHPSYAPQKLTRVTANSWTLAEVDFLIPPMLKENITTTTLTLAATTGSGINMTASSSLFVDSGASTHVGSKWRVGHRREAAEVNDDSVSGTGVLGSPSTIFVVGTVNFRTYGVWDLTVTVQRQNSITSAWEDVGVYTSADDANFDLEFNEPDPGGAFYRMNVTAFSTSTSGRFVLERQDYIHYALVEVTSVTSATVAVVDFIIDGIATTATEIWQEGAWSGYRGFPKTSSLYQLRMVYAGSTYEPQTLWATATDDLENFDYSSADDGAFRYTLGATERNQIEWIVSQKKILIGTSGGEWSLGGPELEGPLTPSNGFSERHSSYGSSNLRGLLVNNVILFAQRRGKKVRELVYSVTEDNFIAANVTQLSEHITQQGLVDVAYQQQDESIYWGVTTSGRLVGMTYERDQNVLAWHRHDTNGNFEAVQTIYGSGADEVWFIVNRTIGGGTKRYVERFNPVEWSALEDAFYVDCGLTYDGSATTTITGLDHLEGEAVNILADGYMVEGKTVSSGSVTLDKAASTVQVGLGYRWEYRPMPLDIDANTGVTQEVTKRISELHVRITNSLGMNVANNSNVEVPVSFRDMTDQMDASPGLKTGIKRIIFEGDNRRDSIFTLTSTQALPMQIDLIVVKYKVTGK